MGVVVALTKQVEFESRITILPEKGGAALGNNATGLLKQFGLSFPSPSDYSIQPVNYKYVVSGIRFQKSIIKSTIILESGEKITFYDYLDSISSSEFFYFIPYFFESDKKKPSVNLGFKFYQISEGEKRVIEQLQDRLTITIDEITGIISITGKMPDPVASSSLVINAKDELNNYLQEVSTTKSRRNLEFILSELDKAETKFLEKQIELSKFISSNKNISSESIKFKRQNLEQEYQLLREIYSNLSQQKRQAEIDLNKSVDSFIVLTDPIIPQEKSEPKRKRIVILFFMIGVFISLVLIFIYHHRENFKDNLASFRNDLRSS